MEGILASVVFDGKPVKKTPSAESARRSLGEAGSGAVE
jgi:hypothetical protein